MAKNPTTWANNDVKAPANWTPATKQKSQWANNVTKNPAQFTPVTKSLDNWSKTSNGLQTYFYNDPNMTYNSPQIEYNYLVNDNQLNQRSITSWSPA